MRSSGSGGDLVIKNGAITSLKPVQALYFCVYVSVGHRHHALLCLETVGHDAVEVAEEAVKRPRIVRGLSDVHFVLQYEIPLQLCCPPMVQKYQWYKIYVQKLADPNP